MADDNKFTSEQQAQFDAATVMQSRAAARKAEADASAAETTAATARLKAAFGDAPAAPYSGAVKMEDGAGLAEINALARSSLAKLADRIVADLAEHLETASSVFVSANDTFPVFANHHALELRLKLIETIARAAEAARLPRRGAPEAPPRGAALVEAEMLAPEIAGLTAASLAGSVAASPIAAAGLALSGAGALLSYFKSDFSIGGSAISVADRALILCVAQRLRNYRAATVVIDGFLPLASASRLEAFYDRFDKLAKSVAALREQAAERHAPPAESGAASAAKPSADAAKEKHAPRGADEGGSKPVDSPARDGVLSARESAISLFDALTADVCADAGGMPLFERATREATLLDLLGNSAMFLSLKMDGAWGTHFSRTNLFTGFFNYVPVKISATTAASWAAVRMATGILLKSGLVTDRRPMQWIEDFS
jgi:hypothetical protein